MHTFFSKCWHHLFRWWLVTCSLPSHYLKQNYFVNYIYLGTNVCVIWIKVQQFQSKLMRMSGKWQPICIDLNVIKMMANHVVSTTYADGQVLWQTTPISLGQHHEGLMISCGNNPRSFCNTHLGSTKWNKFSLIGLINMFSLLILTSIKAKYQHPHWGSTRIRYSSTSMSHLQFIHWVIIFVLQYLPLFFLADGIPLRAYLQNWLDLVLCPANMSDTWLRGLLSTAWYMWAHWIMGCWHNCVRAGRCFVNPIQYHCTKWHLC